MNQQIILALIPYVVPSAVGLIVYAYHQVFRALPVKQQEALKQLELLAMPAVQQVEQLYANDSPQAKKNLAIEVIELGFKLSDLPMPDEKLVSAFIESAVYAMNKLQSNATPPVPAPVPAPTQGNAS